MKVTVKHDNSGIDKKNHLFYNTFIKFLQNKYPLKHDVVINFVSQRVGHMTTGSRHENDQIYILTKKRINRDILRTLAHEWVHEYQRTILNYPKGPNIGGRNEDMANAKSGSLMKQFEKLHPKYEKKMYE